MFIRVKLLNGLPEPLWYSVPHNFYNKSLLGLIVQVPLRNRILPALVIEEYVQKPSYINFELKNINGIEPLPADEYYLQFLKKLGHYYHIDSLYFIKRIHHFLTHKKEDPLYDEKNTQHSTPTGVKLTPEQQRVCDFITPALDNNRYLPTVLHGITGSGKTEIYKHIILRNLNNQKTTLLLLPEVTLAIAFENRLKQELPTIEIHGFHSGKSPKEKNIIWKNLLNKIPMIIIGVHLPILLPIANLGAIIIDEEHDIGYQEKKHPKINSKEAAIIRAQIHRIPILLGSATPALSTLYNVKTKKWKFFQLKERFSGSLPTVQTVSLTKNKNRRQFWISKELENAINSCLQKKEQIIIFINRRGVSFFVQCKNCTFIFSCTNCSVSLTLHEEERLLCHYCGITNMLPPSCPQCKAREHNFLKKGIGTQKVVSILEKMFPHATIARADMDTTIKKKVWQETITNMTNGTIDILVGTQTITKGFHFPRVTLVGVIWADLHLGFPLYNASETALQQLIQVAGRAGRNCANSLVIIQTMADRELFNNIHEAHYLNFYADEIAVRQELRYPPTTRFAELELKHANEKKIDTDSYNLLDKLYEYTKKTTLNVTILGPSKPPVAKIKSIHSRKIYMKSDDFNHILQLIQSINRAHYSSSIYFTPNPLN